MCLVDQLPCGSVLTPAISCTKFKIHLAHADSPMAKTGFSVYFLGRTSLCFTDQETQEENMLMDQLPCGSVLTPAISCTKFKIHSAHTDSPMAKKRFFCPFFREDQSLLHRPRNSGREYVDGPTPLWVSTNTSYLLYEVQDPFSACRQSHGQNRFFCLFFREDQSLLHRPRNSGREYVDGPTPLWVSTYTSYLLYKVQDPFSAYRQSHGQNRFFCPFFREDQSLLHRPRNSVREYVDIPTPLWVSTYTSYLLYKVQDPFSTCRQSHGQTGFLSIF